jgi:hypothetical protein
VERLGETHEWGSAIKRLLELAGWTVHDPVPAFAGDGQLFLMTKRVDGRAVELRATGNEFVDVATELLQASYQPYPPSPLPLHHTPVGSPATAAVAGEPTEAVQLQLDVPAA